MHTRKILSIVALSLLGLCLLCALAKNAMKDDKAKKACDNACSMSVFAALTLLAVSQLMGEKESYCAKGGKCKSFGAGCSEGPGASEGEKCNTDDNCNRGCDCFDASGVHCGGSAAVTLRREPNESSRRGPSLGFVAGL